VCVGVAAQVRVAMGREPAHFVRMFGGRLIVHSGGKASGFRNVHEGDSYDTDGVSLYHVRGTGDENTRAVQVEEEARRLNSGDCFVLLTPKTIYVWKGRGANYVEQATAVVVVVAGVVVLSDRRVSSPTVPSR